MPVRNIRTRGGRGSGGSPTKQRISVMAQGDADDFNDMTLYEKLQAQDELEQHQLQNTQQQSGSFSKSRGERGPLLDSDHYIQKQPAASSDNSVGSGWTWASKSTNTSSRIINLHSKYTNKNVIRSAFGEKIKSVVNCTKGGNRGSYDGVRKDDDDEHYQQQPKSDSIVVTFIKICCMLVIIVMVTNEVKRRMKRRRKSYTPYTMDSAINADTDNSLFSLSSQYLRSGNSASSSSISNMQQNQDHTNTIIHQAIFPQHLSHLTNLTQVYNPKIETPYFWDVHFSGESIAEHVFTSCHELVLACEFGLRQPDYNEDQLDTFLLDKVTYVNVDTTTGEGIERASNLGLAQSHLANIIISPHFHNMATQIFTPSSPGRMFALFRHPVDRAISMYYYLAKASWDPHYNPQLTSMSVEQYAKSQYIENNWLTRFLVSKPGGKLNPGDMLMAKKIVKFKCLVGLYDDIETSMARFQRYFGWNVHDSEEKKADVVRCRSDKISQGDKNVLGHPTVREGSVAWKAIVRQNQYDMELYQYVKNLYKIQGEQIFDVVGYEVPPEQAYQGYDERSEAVGGSSSSYADNGNTAEVKLLQDEQPLGGNSMASEFDSAAEGGGSGSKVMKISDEVIDKTVKVFEQYEEYDADGRGGGKSMEVDAMEEDRMEKEYVEKESGTLRIVDGLN